MISNATCGGTPDRIKFFVQQGCIRPLCNLLTIADTKILSIALDWLKNSLKVGKQEMFMTGQPN